VRKSRTFADHNAGLLWAKKTFLMDNVGNILCIMHSTTINKTPHEVRLPAQTKSFFIPDKCRLARQRTDETTPPTNPISENSSVTDWSCCLLSSDKIDDFVGARNRETSYLPIYIPTFVPDKSSLARQRQFGEGDHVPPHPAPRTPMETAQWST